MRYLSSIITFLFILILVLFAASNKDETSLQLFSLEITAPLYLLTFMLVFVGFLVGGFVAWNAGRKHRRAGKLAQKRLLTVENDYALMRVRAEAAEERLAQVAARPDTTVIEAEPAEAAY